MPVFCASVSPPPRVGCHLQCCCGSPRWHSHCRIECNMELSGWSMEWWPVTHRWWRWHGCGDHSSGAKSADRTLSAVAYTITAPVNSVLNSDINVLYGLSCLTPAGKFLASFPSSQIKLMTWHSVAQILFLSEEKCIQKVIYLTVLQFNWASIGINSRQIQHCTVTELSFANFIHLEYVNKFVPPPFFLSLSFLQLCDNEREWHSSRNLSLAHHMMRVRSTCIFIWIELAFALELLN